MRVRFSIAAPHCFARCLSEDGLSADQRGFQRCSKEDWELLAMAETVANRIEGVGTLLRPIISKDFPLNQLTWRGMAHRTFELDDDVLGHIRRLFPGCW